jgi:AcrR family transcriptional regulator
MASQGTRQGGIARRDSGGRRVRHEALVDGRRAWRDRNLNAVVDALLDLFAEGNLRPGADEIAVRSGVSRRSVFRYFDDLDSLDRVAIERQTARVAHLVELPAIGEGRLPDRIARIVAQRIELFDGSPGSRACAHPSSPSWKKSCNGAAAFSGGRLSATSIASSRRSPEPTELRRSMQRRLVVRLRHTTCCEPAMTSHRSKSHMQ